jgi:hypothetical protein
VRIVETQTLSDPEFDSPHRPAVRKPPRDVVRFYQRLVVNPFLAVSTVLLTLLVAYLLGNAARADVVPAAAILGSIVAVLVLQYHCLDCGGTGSFHRGHHHACPRVVERWETPFSAASHHFPMLGTQLILWCVALFVAGIAWLFTRA